MQRVHKNKKPAPRPIHRGINSVATAAMLCAALMLGFPAFAAGPQALPLPGDLPDSARAEGAFDREEARLRAHLLIHPKDPRQVGIVFEVDPGWHMYWSNPGDSGLATEIRLATGSAPTEESEPAALSWPTPYAFAESFLPGESLITYGYGGQVLLATRLDAAPAAGSMIYAEARALVCDDQCIPATLTLSREVPANRSALDEERSHALFAAAAERLPVTPTRIGAQVDGVWAQDALRPGDRVEGGIRLRSCIPSVSPPPACARLRLGDGDLAFFPYEDDTWIIEERGARLGEDPNTAILALVIERLDAGEAPLRGVLVALDENGVRRGLEIEVAPPLAVSDASVEALPLPWLDPVAGAEVAASEPAPAATHESSLSFATVLWLAFVGGLILNLMPCVLPVLAIKVFSVAELAHRSRREVLSHGAAYSAGILLTMLALAALVVALRGAGRSVGWGFQFQEPLFVAFVATVVVVFALNLLGVFEIRFDPGKLASVGAESSGARRSFFEGLLAVVLATPCSAPFLGTAVGFAFSSSAAQIFGVFAAIGAGLAAPYALITAIPAWSHVIPRPGPWMVKLRAGLGFLLLGSAVWLVWIFGRSAGLEAVTALLAFLLFTGFVAWIYGGLPQDRPLWAPATLGVVLLAGAFLGVNQVSFEPTRDTSSEGVLGAPYDRAAVGAELEAGRTVFSYFTADWCITCKVNEHRVLDQPEVQAELDRLDVAVFRGDWTQRDEAIRAELARYGKAGVPVYVVVHPNAPEEPLVLPELLTRDRLFAALAP